MIKTKNHIYICTPASPFNIVYLDKGIQKLKKLGFQVTLSRYALGNIGNTSGTIPERVEDLHEGFLNPTYDIIMAARGGFNSNELLPYLDYELISRHPKKFVGFSDMSTLDSVLYQQAHMQTYYGSMLVTFAKDSGDENYDQFLHVLDDPQEFTGFYRNGIKQEYIYRKGKMKGKLTGGNIVILGALIGTPYQLQIPEGSILFLEDDDEPTGPIIQKILTQMKLAGFFEHISGLVIGTFLPTTKFEPHGGIKEILDVVIGEYTFPVLTNADFGHIRNPLLIPYGLHYQLKV